jgi:hypothetical protein
VVLLNLAGPGFVASNRRIGDGPSVWRTLALFNMHGESFSTAPIRLDRNAKLVSELNGLLFQFLFGFRQIPQDSLLHFLPDAAANKTSEETAQTVGSAAIDCDEPEARSARWIGNEHPKFEGGPEVVARIKHL